MEYNKIMNLLEMERLLNQITNPILTYTSLPKTKQRRALDVLKGIETVLFAFGNLYSLATEVSKMHRLLTEEKVDEAKELAVELKNSAEKYYRALHKNIFFKELRDVTDDEFDRANQ